VSQPGGRVVDVEREVTGKVVPARVVPPIIGVRVPGADVVIKMGGEPWRLVSVRRQPPLALLVRMRADRAGPASDQPS
jgi:hypothetical protein